MSDPTWPPPKTMHERKRNHIVELILKELSRAEAKFPKFASDHEGYAVLLEEVDELWDEIKANNRPNTQAEAIQVAAMALRLILDHKEPDHV